MSDKKSIGEALHGIEIIGLPEGSVALDAIVLIKAMDPTDDGPPQWYTRYTEGLSTVESSGALLTALDLEREHVKSLYQTYGDDDEED